MFLAILCLAVSILILVESNNTTKSTKHNTSNSTAYNSEVKVLPMTKKVMELGFFDRAKLAQRTGILPTENESQMIYYNRLAENLTEDKINVILNMK